MITHAKCSLTCIQCGSKVVPGGISYTSLSSHQVFQFHQRINTIVTVETSFVSVL